MALDLSGFGMRSTAPAAARGGSTVAGLAGAGTQAGAGAYGAVPTMPSPSQTQAQALSGNLNQMAQIQRIMQAINEQSAQSAMYPLTLNLPNYQNAMGQAMGNVQQNLAGAIPGDVWSQMQQAAAERGVAMGSPTSPNANSALLRALGLTSLGLQQQGQQNLTNLMAAVPRGTLFDPSQLLVTPAQQQEAQYMANVLAAAPNPAAAAAAEQAAIQAGMSAGQGASGRGVPGPTTVSFPSGGGFQGSTGSSIAPYSSPELQRAQQATFLETELARKRAEALAAQPYYNLPSYAGPTVAPTTYGMPADTFYNPYTDQSQYTYGIPQYYGAGATGWGNQPVSSGQMFMGSPEDYYADDLSAFVGDTLGLDPWETADWLGP